MDRIFCGQKDRQGLIVEEKLSRLLAVHSGVCSVDKGANGKILYKRVSIGE